MDNLNRRSVDFSIKIAKYRSVVRFVGEARMRKANKDYMMMDDKKTMTKKRKAAGTKSNNNRPMSFAERLAALREQAGHS